MEEAVEEGLTEVEEDLDSLQHLTDSKLVSIISHQAHTMTQIIIWKLDQRCLITRGLLASLSILQKVYDGVFNEIEGQELYNLAMSSSHIYYCIQ